MFHTRVEEKSGVGMELEMIYTLLGLMDHIYGLVNNLIVLFYIH